MKGTRILLWAPFGAGNHFWGPGTSAYRLYKNNTDISIQVDLVHATKLQVIDKNVYHNQFQLGNIFKTNIFNTFLYFIRSKTWISKNYNNYDVFHGIGAFETTFRPAIYWVKMGKPAFIKITGAAGGFGNNSWISKFLGLSRFRKNNINLISGYIVISDEIEKNLLSHGVLKEKIIRISNGVNTKVFRPVNLENKNYIRDILGISNKFTFCYVGGLTKNKNVIEIVKSINELVIMGFDVQFIVVGPDRSNGALKKEILEYIEANDLNKFILMFEESENPEMYFQASDAFVLVSNSEGMPNALLEAMACKLPSIVTDISGNKDLITNNVHGLMCLPVSWDITKKMIELIECNELRNRMAQNAFDRILDKFSSELIWQKHMNLFRNATEGKF